MRNLFLLNLILLKVYFITLSIRIQKWDAISIETDQDPKTDEYLLNIEKKQEKIVVKNYEFPEPSIHINGIKYEGYKNNQSCFKVGKVESDNSSNIFLYTCNNIRGIMYFNHKEHYIIGGNNNNYSNELIENNESNEPTSIISKCESIKVNNSTSKVKRKEKLNQNNNKSEIYWLKLSIIVPYKMFINKEYCNEDIEKTISFALENIYYLNYFYAKFSIKTVLMHVDIRTNEEYDITFDQNTKGVDLLYISLKNRQNLQKKSLAYDSTILFTPWSHSNKIGMAYLSRLCYQEFSVAFTTAEYPYLMVSTIAHELGHLFGLRHTDEQPVKDNCTCKEECLMNAGGHSVKYDKKSWSNCDEKFLNDFLSKTPLCLLIKPDKKPLNENYCGNKIVNVGEECDCGLEEECKLSKKDKCCDSNTCKFINGAKCSNGACCHNCMIAKNISCNAEYNECAVGICVGTSEFCQINEKEKNIQQNCNNKMDNCFNNVCIEYNSFCKSIFGINSRIADPGCFKYFNKRGDKFGNCGKDVSKKKFFSCNSNDILCGKFVCEEFSSDLSGEYQFLTHNTCIAGTVNNTFNEHDIFTIPNGTPCGNKKVCYDQKCISKNSAITKMNIEKCGHYAFVNSHKECECLNEDFIKVRKYCYMPAFIEKHAAYFLVSCEILLKILSLCFLISTFIKFGKINSLPVDEEIMPINIGSDNE